MRDAILETEDLTKDFAGFIAVNGVNLRDYPLVQGVLVFMASAVVLINLVTDLLYSFVDPRIRFQG